MDIEALADLAGQLLRAYLRCGIGADFSFVIESLKQEIQDPRWDWKVKYVTSMWQIHVNADRQAARNEISNLNFKSCSDIDLLALYYDVRYRELPLMAKLKICDKIIKLSKDEAYKFQYKTSKGVELFLAGDKASGVDLIEKALRAYSRLPAKRKSLFGDLQFAHGLSIFAELSSQQDVARRAAVEFHDLFKRAQKDGVSVLSLADIARAEGCSLLNCAEFARANRCFSTSIELNDNNAAKVFAARALLYLSDIPGAKHLLEEVEAPLIDSSEQFDYGVSWALVACESLASEDVDRAIFELERSGQQNMFFSEKRLGIIVQMKSIKTTSNAGIAKRFIRVLSRYMELKPNFFGIGLNLNRVIDDRVHSDYKAP